MININNFFIPSTWIIPVVMAVVLHELAHGYIAFRLGDDTALKQGRLSLNPLKHFDPIGTIALPLFLIITNSPFIYGWAKPVPVSLLKLKNPKKAMALIAIAGPLTNIAIAFLAVVLFKIFQINARPESMLLKWFLLNIINCFAINLTLAAFNLIPLPPLDGSKVLAGFLPHKMAVKMMMFEKQAMVLLILLIFLPSFIHDFIGIDVNILGWYVNSLKKILASVMFKGVGI